MKATHWHEHGAEHAYPGTADASPHLYWVAPYGHEAYGTDTLVTFVEGDGRATAWVTVRCLQGYRWWTRPDARTLRALVDDAIAKSGKPWRREPRAARLSYNDGPLNTWRFAYPLIPA